MRSAGSRVAARQVAGLSWVVALSLAACAPEAERPQGTRVEDDTSAQPVGLFMAPSEAVTEGVAQTATDWTVVHVDRTRDAFSAGHIPGARFLPFASLAIERDGVPNEFPPDEELAQAFEVLGISNSSRVLLTGWPLGVARAWIALDMLGLGDQSFILDGGQTAWQAAGGAVTTDERAFDGGSLSSSVDRGAVVDADWVNDRRTAEGVAILDARPAEQFSGEEPGGGVARGGHIPGAGHLHWESLRGPDGELFAAAELEQRFAAAGVLRGDTVVAYCRTGVQAGYLYVVARHLGYDARLYDGSYIEWSGRGDLPVEEGS